MEDKVKKSNVFKNAALTATFAQLLLVSNISLAADNTQSKNHQVKQASIFEVIDTGSLLAAGDTNVVCGNNYGCV